jgi:hypothetical protein
MGHGLTRRRAAGASAWRDEGDEKRRGGARVARNGRPRDEGRHNCMAAEGSISEAGDSGIGIWTAQLGLKSNKINELRAEFAGPL